MRGRFVFSNAQIFGRIGALVFSGLRRKAAESNGSQIIGEDFCRSLRWWAEHMATAPPRKAPVGNQARPIYLFTDGACEPDSEAPFYISASYEAVLYAPEDGAL